MYTSKENHNNFMTLLTNIVNVCYVLYFSIKLHVAYITILLRTLQIHLCAVIPSLTNYAKVIAFVHNMGYRKLVTLIKIYCECSPNSLHNKINYIFFVMYTTLHSSRHLNIGINQTFKNFFCFLYIASKHTFP